ncbi:hypothetical protein BDV30DRAFT_217546 [Aspergillus minisclerotigenes]|uniref:Uncharacterized protein n=1 Tax=Aspergillus minisclerotigenes TaxID=656917 RepID=A0A5N6ISX2_9EURO|nr:hypothetical protein BDV30DRAFT_217546 [Aspergillus minisclerotigenes]
MRSLVAKAEKTATMETFEQKLLLSGTHYSTLGAIMVSLGIIGVNGTRNGHRMDLSLLLSYSGWIERVTPRSQSVHISRIIETFTLSSCSNSNPVAISRKVWREACMENLNGPCVPREVEPDGH